LGKDSKDSNFDTMHPLDGQGVHFVWSKSYRFFVGDLRCWLIKARISFKYLCCDGFITNVFVPFLLFF